MLKAKINPKFTATTSYKFTNYRKIISIGHQNLVSKNSDTKNSEKHQCKKFCYEVNVSLCVFAKVVNS